MWGKAEVTAARDSFLSFHVTPTPVAPSVFTDIGCLEVRALSPYGRGLALCGHPQLQMHRTAGTKGHWMILGPVPSISQYLLPPTVSRTHHLPPQSPTPRGYPISHPPRPGPEQQASMLRLS